MSTAVNRRCFQRFTLEPMYTPVLVRVQGHELEAIEGHVYDISEGGVRFELDRAVPEGSEITLQVTLPTTDPREIGPGRALSASGRVVWVDDSDGIPPVKMAAEFSRFVHADDRDRLIKAFSSGRFRMAA